MLGRVREALGLGPRPLIRGQNPLAFPEPEWMRELTEEEYWNKSLITQSHEIWQNGLIRWGMVVRANAELFEPGEADQPGTLLIATTEDDFQALHELPTVVGRLQTLRHTVEPDPSWAEEEFFWWKDLNDDFSTHCGYPVPPTWPVSSKGEFLGFSTLFHRGHLPSGQIDGRLMPVIVLAIKRPWLCVPVPSNLWPPSFADQLLNYERWLQYHQIIHSIQSAQGN
jgi:hypothetical protein